MPEGTATDAWVYGLVLFTEYFASQVFRTDGNGRKKKNALLPALEKVPLQATPLSHLLEIQCR